MGVIRGEWLFAKSTPPSIDAIVTRLQKQTGLLIECNRHTLSVAIPLLKESLFDWEYHPDRLVVHGFIPAHPYLWTQLNNVIINLGATASSDPIAWKPLPDSALLSRPWSSLSPTQRFIFRLPALGPWRPFDFLTRQDLSSGTP